MKIVAISGSLRAHSSNAALLGAAAVVAPPGVELDVYEGLSSLPLFNPDFDEEGMTPPPPVAELRARLADADGVMLCSPEYAHGMPGALKNALDWLVSVGALLGLAHRRHQCITDERRARAGAARRGPQDDVVARRRRRLLTHPVR
jgi:NAD(P)H-dependent FMN reductase